MNSMCARAFFYFFALGTNTVLTAAEVNRDAAYWVEPMKKVHAQFTGARGTFAQFGDSITFTMAFWAPMAAKPRHVNEAAAQAHAVVTGHMKAECWSQWKGPEFGNQGSMTIRWAQANVDKWLTKLNPETAVIMFGSNDVGQMESDEYEQKLRAVVERCLRNGTVVLLTTAPPRGGRLEKSRQFAEKVRQIAREKNIPLIDYCGEILQRRPIDWDGTLPHFKGLPGDEYQVPTLIARDGVHPSNTKQFVNDFSEEGLSRNGFTLRNYLTLMAYAEVISRALNR